MYLSLQKTFIKIKLNFLKIYLFSWGMVQNSPIRPSLTSVLMLRPKNTLNGQQSLSVIAGSLARGVLN